MSRNRSGLSASRTLFVGALLLMLAGCLEGARPGSPSGELAGTWVIGSAGCQHMLSLHEDETFEFAMLATQDGAPLQREVRGDYALGNSAQGNRDIEFRPSTPVDVDSLPYCGLWREQESVVLDQAELEAAAGLELGEFSWHEELSGLLGKVILGMDSDGVDRLALFARDLTIEAFRTDPPEDYPWPLFNTVPSRAVRDLGSLIEVPDVDLPENSYVLTIPVDAASIGQILDRFAFNILAAADVELAVSGADSPICRLEAYSDFSFLSPTDPPVFDELALQQVVRINPLDETLPLVQETVTSGGESRAAHLLPIAVRASSEGTCTIEIRARPAAVAILEDNVSALGAEPLMAVPIPADAHSVTVLTSGHPLYPRRVLSAEHLFVRGLRAPPLRWVARSPAPAEPAQSVSPFDPLNLLGLSRGSREISVQARDGEEWMNLFAHDPDIGTGPFRRLSRSDLEDNLSIPGEVTVTAPIDGGGTAYRFTIDFPRTVNLWADGDADTSAVLADWRGLIIAGDENSGPDGAGFRILRRLEPGRYVLRVSSSGSGTYTVRARGEDSLPVDDETWLACLYANQVEFGDLNMATEIHCVGEGIESIDGIQGASNLEVLELASNRIQDLSPLEALTNLRILGLAGNQISSLEPLIGLDRLLVLNLAGNPLDVVALAQLEPLAGKLRELHLTGIEDLTTEDAAALQELLPNTIILGPDGLVVE